MSHNIPAPRPLSDDDKKRDLIRLLSDGRALLDPPPAVGATKPPAPKLADPHSIRPENLPADPGDGVALKVIANLNPAERAAKIAHLREHGNCSSWVWASTGTPGKLTALPGPMAPDETETLAPCRETFKDGPVERRPVVVTARFERVYSYLSDTRLPNNRGAMFWSSDKDAKLLPGSHREMTDPLMDLVAKANTWRLPKQDERQSWAQFLDTGAEDVRQRLVNSCATKCLFHARKLPDQERWEAFHALRDSIGKIIDKREFDPDRSTLPTFVDKTLALRVKDIKRAARRREKLFDGNPAKAEMIAEAVDLVEILERRLADITDEVDRQIIKLTLDGETQGAIAVELGFSQQAISKRIKKIGAGGCKTTTAVRIGRHGTEDTHPVPPRLERAVSYPAFAPGYALPLGGSLAQAEPSSFVPEGERRTQRPVGSIAPAQILSSFRQPEMAPGVFLNPTQSADVGGQKGNADEI